MKIKKIEVDILTLSKEAYKCSICGKKSREIMRLSGRILIFPIKINICSTCLHYILKLDAEKLYGNKG